MATDLIARIQIDSPNAIIDLGCGSGEVTNLLAERWPHAAIIGVDNSEEMLAVAEARNTTVQWVHRDINHWRSDFKFDLVFSNAALHWIDDHRRLFVRLSQSVNPRGVLAVQMPRNYDAASHTALVDTVTSGAWREALTPLLRRNPVWDAKSYYELLSQQFGRVDIWETEYLHVLEGKNPVAAWTKGTLLRPFLSALTGEQCQRFETEYRRRILKAYPPDVDDKTVFLFKRLFILATK